MVSVSMKELAELFRELAGCSEIDGERGLGCIAILTGAIGGILVVDGTWAGWSDLLRRLWREANQHLPELLPVESMRGAWLSMCKGNGGKTVKPFNRYRMERKSVVRICAERTLARQIFTVRSSARKQESPGGSLS